MPEPTIRVLSLGAGVQSTTLLLMACYEYMPGHTLVPKPDAAIFADTGGEPEEVYTHLSKLEKEAARYGIPVYRVSAGNLAADVLKQAAAQKPGGIPYYLEGTRGRGNRYCTRTYKIRPVHRKVRELLGAAPPGFRKVPGKRVAEVWIGFSEDEILRVNHNYPVKYITPRFPLIELGYTRENCKYWLAKRGWEPARSACVFCPYHSDNEWKRVKSHPADWAEAVRVDAGLNGAFLHADRKPLPIVEFRGKRGAEGGCSPYGCRMS